MVALDRGHPDPLGSKRMELGSHIKEHRTELGLSQDDLAEHIYVSRQTISNWECGLSVPDAEMLVALGETLDVPVSKDEARGDGALPRTARRETLRVASDDLELGAGQDVSGRPEPAHAEHPIRHLHRHAREGRRDRYGRGSRKRSQAHGNADAMAGRADARAAGGGVRTDTVAGV